MLLEAGADPNKRCGSGFTAAHRAARAGNLGVLRELLTCGRVQWDLCDWEGRTPRALAVQHGQREAVALIQEGLAERPKEGEGRGGGAAKRRATTRGG